MTKSDGKIFYPSFFDSIEEIEDDHVFRTAVEAAMAYAFRGEEPDLDKMDPLAKIVYRMARPLFDSNETKKVNGSKGGRPKNDDETSGFENKNLRLSNKKTSGFENKNQWLSKTESTETVTDTDTVTDTNNTSTNVDVRDTRVSQSEIKEITFAWNSLPEPVPRIQKLTEGSSRMKSLKARIKQYSTADVLTAIDNVRHSPFLLGQVKDFVITFDWFVKPTNFPKVLDGNYLDRNADTARSGTTEENVDAEYEKRFEETMREEGLIT